MRITENLFLLIVSLFGFTSLTRAEENWPQFRGPTGLGYSSEKSLPLEWGGKDNKNLLWSAPLVGEGHASPIVWKNQVVVCTAQWPADVVDKSKTIPEHHVVSYSTETGEKTWDTVIPHGPWLRSDFRSGAGGGYAAPTPATDGRRVFVLFGSSVLAALDLQGTILWRKEIVPHTFDVTVGSSPVLFGDNVILLCAMANKKDSRLVAFEQATGNQRWETKLPETGFAHSTPVIVSVDDKPQLLAVASGGGSTPQGLMSFDPENGKLLWWAKSGGDAASVAFANKIVYADSGRGGPGVAVEATGSGDVTASHTKWTVATVPEGIGSPIIVGDYVYRLHTPSILKCWKLSDGEQVHTQRLNGLSSTWASPFADANGRLYYVNGGKSFVIQSGPEYKVLAENDLADANHASAAVSNGKIFVVGLKKLHCVGEAGSH